MTKVRKCVECGEAHQRRKVSYCYHCGRRHMEEAAGEILKKQGRYYEKWKSRWEAATGLKMKGGK